MNIYDIAKEAGVSIATVSRVINDNTQVNEGTKKKVEEVLKKYSYTPNAIARGLVGRSMKTVGVLTIDIRDLYYANVAYTIEQEFNKLGYNVILCNTGGDIQQKIKYMKVLAEKKVDGLILVGSPFKDKGMDEAIAEISKSLTVVMVNGFLKLDNVYSIICDDGYGIASCVDYLAGKGHKHIVYLQDAETYSGQSKTEGFKSGMAKNQLEFSSHSIKKVEKGLKGGCIAVEQLIASEIDFTAIVAGEDITAVGAIKKLKELNKSIPKDVAIIGFNNSIIAQCCDPELTSVDNKVETMGISAARILYDVLSGVNVPSKTVITPDLVERSST
jgi:LacI family transcriptional regulator